MALFNVSVWQRSRFTLQWFIINLLGSLACLTAVALAQFEWSEGVSGSVSIPDVAFTCLGNLAVFMTAFTRGRLDMENGARDVLATTRGPKLNTIDGCVLTTRPPNDLRRVDVVMLSKYNHSYLTQFMQYISHSHALDSILVQSFPFRSAPVSAEVCTCSLDCQCFVLWATEEIMIMLAHRLPRTLKRLSVSQCLLPSVSCLRNGCHGCNQALLYVEGYRDVEAAVGNSEPTLREGDRSVDHAPAAVCEAVEGFQIEEDSCCICIPVHPGNADRWTKFLIKFLKSKGKDAKGVKVEVSDTLQTYITHSTQELGFLFRAMTLANEIYDSASIILPRFAEVTMNIVLTGWLRVDGFSSSLVARRAIRDHVVDSTGTGFAANAFLTQSLVFGSADGTNVCQVLWFRGGILNARRVSYMVGCVNLICSITWSVLMACEDNWAPSMPPSTPRVAVIIGAIGVALAMDCFDVGVALGMDCLDVGEARAGARARAWARAQVWAQGRVWAQGWARARAQARAQAKARARARFWGLMAVVILEIGCIASLVVSLSMNKGLGRWVYSGMQVLVWVKWGIGSFLLGDNASEYEDGNPFFRIVSHGTWVYCSAFLLNAMSTGAQRKWVYLT